MITFVWLCVGHALADYPLQGDFLARAKNHRKPIPDFPWQWALFMHSLIHAGTVAFITHSFALGAVELGAHIVIDWLKSDGRINVTGDQVLHLTCKAIYALCLVFLK